MRYPRGTGPGTALAPGLETLPLGQGEVRRQGSKIAFLAFGSMVAPCLAAAEELDATVANMRFVKPLDRALVERLAASHDLLVTVEETSVIGGAGTEVCRALEELGTRVQLLRLGLPDQFIDHGDPARLLADAGLDGPGIVGRVRQELTRTPAA